MKTTILNTRLDNILQRFLRVTFNCPEHLPRFMFPNDHDFVTCLQFIMKPERGEQQIYGDKNFIVDLPLSIHQEQGIYSLNEKALKLFERRVRAYWLLEFHSEMARLHKSGYSQKDSIEFIQLKYDLPDDESTYERLKKDFYRWSSKKSYRKKHKSAA